MKSNMQTASPAKAQILKGVKSAKRKTKVAAKRTSRTASRLAGEAQATMSGYSEQAQRLIKRGKAAFGDASTWASEAAADLPKTARNVGLPDQRAINSFMSEKPLIIGAVGLGLGVVIGAMLPSMSATKAKPVRRK